MARYIYNRVSTDEQNYDQQMHEIQLYFISHGLNMDEVADVVAEHESGGKSYTDRKFQQLLNKCKPGDYIYAASTDRLGRDFFDMMRLMKDAKKRGVIIVACKDNLSLDDDNPIAKIVLSVTSIIDEDERKRTKRRTANKKASQREQIKKRGYFIIENGPNAGKPCNYVGNPKWDDMSDAQQNALTRAQEASQLARHNAVILFRANSMAYRYACREYAGGKTITVITKEVGVLFDDFAALHPDEPNPYATPKGCKPSKGTISQWLREANPLVLAV